MIHHDDARDDSRPGPPEPGVARRATFEEWVATVPLAFGLITSLLAAWPGLRLGGLPACLFAGSARALSPDPSAPRAVPARRARSPRVNSPRVRASTGPSQAIE